MTEARGVDCRKIQPAQQHQQGCGSVFGTWVCDREAGHQGLHVAHVRVLRTWAPSCGAINCDVTAFAAVWENINVA